MALKEKALKRMAEKLNAAGVHYSVGASWLLCQKGILDVYHDFDVVVPLAESEAANRVLRRLGMCSGVEMEEGLYRASFHFDGADIDLSAGMCFDCGLRAVVNEHTAVETVSVLGVPVALGALEDWLVWYALYGRMQRAEAIHGYLKAHGPVRKERFRACVDGPLPEQVEALIRDLE